MVERWIPIPNFEGYSVSNYGRIRTDRFDKILSAYANQSGLVQVGLMRNGKQYHRSVPLLVAKEFVDQPSGPFDTPINLDGDRFNNHVDNLMWRPRWFAVKYNRQFREPYENSINAPIEDIESGEISENSLECAKQYGLLEREVVLAILNNTYVWPTYQRFQIAEEN